MSAVEVASLTHDMLNATVENVLQFYPTAYPANLFKNASRCRDLSQENTPGHGKTLNCGWCYSCQLCNPGPHS